MSTKRSQYEQLLLESNNQSKSVDIRLGTYSIDYYEDIFSPAISCSVLLVDAISYPIKSQIKM